MLSFSIWIKARLYVIFYSLYQEFFNSEKRILWKLHLYDAFEIKLTKFRKISCRDCVKIFGETVRPC